MSECARTLVALLVLVLSLTAVASVRGEGDDAASRRIVERFDFNEEDEGNFESMPINWFRVEAPGFPRYTTIGFDDAFATIGRHSLKLQLDGGSAAVTLASGVIAVMPQAHYRVSAQVRTQDAVHARARVTAVFLDEQNQPLLETRTRSPLTRSNDGWTPVELDLPQTPDEAAWLTLRLELLQPAEYRRGPQRPNELIEQDIRAAAWFDDVTVYQMPRIELTTQSPVNVVRRPEEPRFNALVHDLSGDALDAELTVYDAAGNVVANETRQLNDSRTGAWELTPELPRFGWYWARLSVRDERAVIGQAVTAVSYLPAATGRGASEADRFMIVIDDPPAVAEYRELIAPIMDRIGPQAVRLNLWHAEMTTRELGEATASPDPLVSRLLEQDRAVALAIGEVPQELALAVGADVDKPLSLFTHTSELWQPNLMALLATYGHRVDQWHLGRVGNTEAFWMDDLPQMHADARRMFRRYVAEPRVTIPWRATYELTAAAKQLPSLLIDLPPSVRPAQIVDYFETWEDHAGNKTIHLRPLETGQHTHSDRGIDLALRMIHTWRHDPRRIALSQPWRHADGPPAAILPDPVLGVWVNVAEQLSGRRFVSDMNLGPGIHGYLLDGPGGGVLLAWNESSPDAEAALDLYLGEDPTAIDIYGNRTPLKQQGERQTLRLTQSPQFIEGINMSLARLRAGFELDEPFIESVHSRHERTLHIANPWRRTITGRLRVTGPERWDIQPRLVNFSIPAGDSLEVPMTITFPISEVAGSKRLTADVQIEADRTYELELAAPVEVGLEGVDFHATPSTQPREDGQGEDAVVTIVVTNLSDREQSFYAFAIAPGQPRAERIISRLGPGETIVRRFRFAAAAADLSGESIRVGLRQSDGPAVLNHIVNVP